MKYALLIILAVSVRAQSFEQKPAWKTFAAAKAFEAGATIADIKSGNRFAHDSRYVEKGPIMAAGGPGLTLGLFGGVTVAEVLIIRKYPRSAKWFSWISVGVGGVHLYGVAHNSTLR